MQEQKDDNLLTVAEVAQYLRVDQTTVRRWIKQGVLNAVCLPHAGKRHAYRIRAETVEAIITPKLVPLSPLALPRRANRGAR